jgi:hypothetical protein
MFAKILTEIIKNIRWLMLVKDELIMDLAKLRYYIIFIMSFQNANDIGMQMITIRTKVKLLY